MSRNSINVAMLLTCFNRKESTLECLENLLQQEDIETFNIQVYLVDDGCTDGTSEAVSTQFSSVNIIQGSGSHYWNGGMRLAWEAAQKEGHDFYIWLNDDSMLYTYAIAKIIKAYYTLVSNNEKPGALIGTMIDPITKAPTYGGRNCISKINPLRLGEVVKPEHKPIRCDTIEGNFVLIPKESVDAIGILSTVYTHGMGDTDYGFRLIEAGRTLWVAPDNYGECTTNPTQGSCKDGTLSLKERLQKMQQPNQLHPAKEWMHFVRAHGGAIWPLLWFKAWIRFKFPILWVLLRKE